MSSTTLTSTIPNGPTVTTTLLVEASSAQSPASLSTTPTTTPSDGQSVTPTNSVTSSISSPSGSPTSPTGTSSSSTLKSASLAGSYSSSQSTPDSSSVLPTNSVSTTTTASSPPKLTSTAVPSAAKSSSNTGYIATIAVLAVLLGIALLALAFLRFRKRHESKQQIETLGSVNYKPKGHAEPAAQVVALERQLQERDEQLRASQAALLAQGRSVGSDAMDERQVSQRFAQVNKSIRDWVVGNFKNMSGNSTATRDVAPLLQGTQPNYRAMLEDPRKKYIVLRSLVAEVLVQAFKSGELVGSPAYSELDSWVRESGAALEISDWRAKTMSLLEKSSAYRTERATSVQEISKRIDSRAADVAGLGYSEQRSSQMYKIVNSVAILVSDLMRQKASYDLVMEKGTFDSVSMEDALQDHGEETLQGKPVQCVVFPAVKKWEDGVERGTNRGRVISKAQVVVT